MGYVAFVLDEKSKTRLLRAFPPVYGRVIAHHVTLKFGVKMEELEAVKEAYGHTEYVRVRGHAQDEATQCVAVSTEHGYDLQANGTPLHITISVADGHKPAEAGNTARLVTEDQIGIVLTGSIQYCN